MEEASEYVGECDVVPLHMGWPILGGIWVGQYEAGLAYLGQ